MYALRNKKNMHLKHALKNVIHKIWYLNIQTKKNIYYESLYCDQFLKHEL